MAKECSWFVSLLAFMFFQAVLAGDIVETIGDGENQITVIYLKGQPYEMGYLHGSALKEQITTLYDSVMKAASNYADPILLDIAYNQMAPYIPLAYKDEMQGLADGAEINVKIVHRMHAIPDLSELDCSFFAAWGSATADGNLYQIRALDYATDIHLQEHPALIVYEPDEGQRFINVGWVGFIGVVSGINYQGISVSEIGDDYDKEFQTMAGEPMPFVLRDVLQFSQSLAQAVNIISTAPRTSSFLYCVGDAKIPSALSLKAGPRYCEVFSDSTNPNPFLNDVVYFSMGVESSWNAKVYNYLYPLLGNINADTGKNLMRDLGTGDLHAVVYDFSHGNLWTANADPIWCDAFRQTFIQYELSRADSFFANCSPTVINRSKENLPSNLMLKQNYPNPFNLSTIIEFEIPPTAANEYSDAVLIIYDLQGNELNTLWSEQITPGNCRVNWDGKNKTGQPVPSGIYFYRLRIGSSQLVRRLLVMR